MLSPRVPAALLLLAAASACNDVPVAQLPFSLKVTKTEASASPIKVDFLWLVDSTPSMCQEQAQLARSLNAFVSEIESFVAIDYRIAFISQDMLTPGRIGVFRAETTRSFPFSCGERVNQVCVSPAELAKASPWLEKVTPQCASGDCGCANLGAGWECDHKGSAKTVLNCNGSFNSACVRSCANDAECDTSLEGPEAGVACAGDPSRCVFTCDYEAGPGSPGVCVRRPDTAACPDSDALRERVIAGAGTVCANGDDCSDAAPCADGSACEPPTVPWLTRKTANDYMKCMGIVGADQKRGSFLEQDLNAVLYALSDEEGAPNREQAQRFVRDDAYLVVVMVTDEDDCSMNQCGVDPADGVWKCGYGLPEIEYETCSCLSDARAGGPPGKALLPVADAVNRIKSLKADPGKVLVAAIAGDSTAEDPAQRAEDRTLYRQSKCSQCPDPSDRHFALAGTSICDSSLGKASYAGRLIEFVEAFGQNGVVANICADEGLGPALHTIADRVIRVFTKVCLPRPIAAGESLVVQTLGPRGTCRNGSACCSTASAACDLGACADGSACVPEARQLAPGTQEGSPTYQLTTSADCASVALAPSQPTPNAVIFNAVLPPGTQVQVDYEADYLGRVGVSTR